MATVNKQIAEVVIDSNGCYADDPQVQAVVSYHSSLSNKWEWALIYPGENIYRYAASEYIQQPKFIWANEKLRNKLIPFHRCVQCQKAFTTANVQTDMGWRETQISGFCETCWRDVFTEKEES